MKLLTNFTVKEFEDLYKIVEEAISKRVHKDSMISPKTRFLLSLCYCKFNEKFEMIGFYFGINPSYAERLIHSTISKVSNELVKEFVRWLSVSDRITDFHVYNEDFPTLLGSVDATAQLISRLKKKQKAYYSGKHKIHCIKTQAFVSPVGLLIHYTKCMEGAMHDFKLFNFSKLADMIIEESEKCQRLLGNPAITLADSGYQGIAKIIPGAVIPYKKNRDGMLNNEKRMYNRTLSKSRIIVENWFSRLKSLGAIIGSKFRLNIDSYQNFWDFCSALTNFHIKKHPLRDFERSSLR